MAFQPNADDVLTIRGRVYRVAEHPASPGAPFALQGRQSIVYQLISCEEDTEDQRHALKIFESRFRMPALVNANDRFVALAEMPGLQVCRREIISARTDGDLLKQHPDLSYAVLMPWIKGPTWMEVMLEAKELTPQDSLKLARSLAEILTNMEERNLAHCDLAGGNVIVAALASDTPSDQSALQLVDVEQLYSPDLTQPAELISPIPGYAYRKMKPRWGADADRLAGAILLAEMLGWCDERVHDLAWGEHYFAPKELQQPDSERYQVLRKVLRKYWGKPAASLLKRTWSSEALSECPTFCEWLSVFPEQVVATTEAEPSEPLDEDMVPPFPVGEDDAAILALIGLAGQLEREGNIPGALAACRQAQALHTTDERFADELADTEERLQGRVEEPGLSDIVPVVALTGGAVAAAPQAPEGAEETWEPTPVEDMPEVAAGTADTLVAGGAPTVPEEPEDTAEPRPYEFPPLTAKVAVETTEAMPTYAKVEAAARDQARPRKKRRGCCSWLVLLILAIAAGAAIYYFVFMLNSQQVVDTLSNFVGRQEPTATIVPLESDEHPPRTDGSPVRPEMASPESPHFTPGAEGGVPAKRRPTGERPAASPMSEPGIESDGPVKPTRELGELTPTPATSARTGAATDVALALGQEKTREADGMEMAAVPAGEFQMGTTDAEVQDVLKLCGEYSGNCEEEWFEKEQPVHTVTLDGFWIDRTEVTNAQFANFLSEQEEESKKVMTWLDLDDSNSQIEIVNSQYQPRSGLDVYPVGLVSWDGANAYCDWAGGRLPTEAEWEYAARGTESRIFPWGDQFDGAKLNYQSSSDGYAELAPVGSFPGGASWCDALDMSGNVEEWTADWFGSYTDEAQSNPKGPALGQYRVSRGGSFRSAPFETRTANRGAGSPTDTNRATGFRCAVSQS